MSYVKWYPPLVSLVSAAALVRFSQAVHLLLPLSTAAAAPSEQQLPPLPLHLEGTREQPSYKPSSTSFWGFSELTLSMTQWKGRGENRPTQNVQEQKQTHTNSSEKPKIATGAIVTEPECAQAIRRQSGRSGPVKRAPALWPWLPWQRHIGTLIKRTTDAILELHSGREPQLPSLSISL